MDKVSGKDVKEKRAGSLYSTRYPRRFKIVSNILFGLFSFYLSLADKIEDYVSDSRLLLMTTLNAEPGEGMENTGDGEQ